VCLKKVPFFRLITTYDRKKNEVNLTIEFRNERASLVYVVKVPLLLTLSTVVINCIKILFERNKMVAFNNIDVHSSSFLVAQSLEN
jgi:hypothetical protein